MAGGPGAGAAGVHGRRVRGYGRPGTAAAHRHAGPSAVAAGAVRRRGRRGRDAYGVRLRGGGRGGRGQLHGARRAGTRPGPLRTARARPAGRRGEPRDRHLAGHHRRGRGARVPLPAAGRTRPRRYVRGGRVVAGARPRDGRGDHPPLCGAQAGDRRGPRAGAPGGAAAHPAGGPAGARRAAGRAAPGAQLRPRRRGRHRGLGVRGGDRPAGLRLRDRAAARTRGRPGFCREPGPPPAVRLSACRSGLPPRPGRGPGRRGTRIRRRTSCGLPSRPSRRPRNPSARARPPGRGEGRASGRCT